MFLPLLLLRLIFFSPLTLPKPMSDSRLPSQHPGVLTVSCKWGWERDYGVHSPSSVNRYPGRLIYGN